MESGFEDVPSIVNEVGRTPTGFHPQNIMHTTAYPMESQFNEPPSISVNEVGSTPTGPHQQDIMHTIPYPETTSSPNSDVYYDDNGGLVPWEAQQKQIIFDKNGNGYYMGQSVIYDEEGNPFIREVP